MNKNSWILRTTKTDTQGCGAGLAEAKLSPFIDITLFDTKTWKVVSASQVWTTMTLSLTCILYTSVFAFTHLTYLQ